MKNSCMDLLFAKHFRILFSRKDEFFHDGGARHESSKAWEQSATDTRAGNVGCPGEVRKEKITAGRHEKDFRLGQAAGFRDLDCRRHHDLARGFLERYIGRRHLYDHILDVVLVPAGPDLFHADQSECFGEGRLTAWERLYA